MTSDGGDCPPGFIRSALGNCIPDPGNVEVWRLGESDTMRDDGAPLTE